MMNQFLAEHYGTKIASAQEPVVTNDEPVELSKEAQIDLFCKLAAQNEIDLDALSEEQIQTLWTATFAKEASEGDEKDDKEKDAGGEPPPFAKKDDDKKDEAKKELEEKKEAMAKMAEADFLGRVMAHSMVQELRKIAEEQDAGEQQETEESKEAAMPAALAKALNKGKDAGKAVGAAASGAAKRGKELITGSKMKEHISNASSKAPAVQHLHMDEAMNEARKVTKARIGAGAAGAAAVGGAAAAASSGKKKKASAIDELAAVEALKLASAEGYDADEAAMKLAAALEIISESEKVASATDVDGAVAIRALELLETAGYPVTWES